LSVANKSRSRQIIGTAIAPRTHKFDVSSSWHSNKAMIKMKKSKGSQVDDLEQAHKPTRSQRAHTSPQAQMSQYILRHRTNTARSQAPPDGWGYCVLSSLSYEYRPTHTRTYVPTSWRCRPKPSPQTITAFGSKSLPVKVGSRAPSDHYSLKENSFP